MRVTVRLGGSLAGAGPGEREVNLPSRGTVGTLLDSAGLALPASPRDPGGSTAPGSPAPIILLNGRNIGFLEGLETPLADGDVVAIFLSGEGG